MKQDYEAIKNEVLILADNALAAIKDANEGRKTAYDSTLEQIAKEIERIKAEKFVLMVVGEAKSGKSTFINAYLSTQILPMDVKQCTSTLITIENGDTPTLTATRADGSKEVREGEEAMSEFLKQNAAIQDDERDIPVAVINSYIMQWRGEKPSDGQLKELFDDVRDQNTHNLKEHDYRDRIRAYIERTRPNWKELIRNIQIRFPYADQRVRNIVIVDSPGINAVGGLGDISNNAVDHADAVMFLKPLSGQVLEATAFRDFLRKKSSDRNKETVFWILTHRADISRSAAEELTAEAGKQCPDFSPENIVSVDSKVKLRHDELIDKDMGVINTHITQIVEDYEDSFLTLAQKKANGSKEALLEHLRRLSNFDALLEAVNSYARKAHYLALSKLLENIDRVLNRAMGTLRSQIQNLDAHRNDPVKLREELEKKNKLLEELRSKAGTELENIVYEFNSTKSGIIKREADHVFNEYRSEMDNLSGPLWVDAAQQLEEISWNRIAMYKRFQLDMQHQLVDRCNAELIKLGEADGLTVVDIEPDFTQEDLDQIKRDVAFSDEVMDITKGKCFKKTKKEFSPQKYFEHVRASILERMEITKDTLTGRLRNIVLDTLNIYHNKLKQNIKLETARYKDLKTKLDTAEDIGKEIQKLQKQEMKLDAIQRSGSPLKAGIGRYVAESI